MEIYSIGYHHAHEKTFCIDRPYGMGDCWLFLLVKTEAVFIIDGMEHYVQPGSFMLYSGSMPEHYGACDDTYIDDWFHFGVSREDEELLGELDIPVGVPTKLPTTAELSSLIRTMTYEFYTGGAYSRQVMEAYLQVLFHKLSRLLHEPAQCIPEGTNPHFDALIRLREEIYRDIRRIGSVSEMAQQLSMSQSAFQHTYKKLFGTNVTSDIAQSRIQHAKTLLTTTNLPLRQVAEGSGYSSEFHLMRHFKSYTGMTPTEFRKMRR